MVCDWTVTNLLLYYLLTEKLLNRHGFWLAVESTYFLSDLETGQTFHIAELLLRLNTWQTGLDESLVIETNLVE